MEANRKLELIALCRMVLFPMTLSDLLSTPNHHIFYVLHHLFTVRRSAHIASAVLATAIPSVCLSVCHTPADGT